MAHRQYRKRLTPVARELRRDMSPAEWKLLWRRLRGSQFGVRFRRQQPIGPYVVDFYCAVVGVVLQLDGKTHAESQEEDAARDAMLASMGLRVLRFPNAEVFRDIESVIRRVVEVVSDLSSR